MKHEPLEIKNAILKELNLQIIADSSGRKFPHPGIEVVLYAPEDADKNKFLAYYDENKLQNEISAFLQEPRCAKANPHLEIGFIEETEDTDIIKKGYQLRYISQTLSANLKYYLEVLEGFANRKQIQLIHQETYIGRCQKVLKSHGGIERINDLYFPDVREIKGKVSKQLKDSENINNSVSRLHARIKFIGGHYFLIDDGSSKGTTILSEGRGMAETVDRFSGKKIGHNDIISFGKAVVRVRVIKKS